jgi:hypothetical protein
LTGSRQGGLAGARNLAPIPGHLLRINFNFGKRLGLHRDAKLKKRFLIY